MLKDPLQGAKFLHRDLTRADPNYTGRVTVPVLWDKATDTLVSDESSEIIRMLNSAFDSIGALPATTIPKRCGLRSTQGCRPIRRSRVGLCAVSDSGASC